ncbi:hypothetical protein BDP55DRAFT_732276 [Colletotrichum godetiae]|uniref:Uncharacterized protein n=1 Tax=Colletotrichum godetiae TaxID=1209918 RepID=A0AAJ0EP90_9PEZI|nr:uncharacterized protein BDP55DRAFT_732276 [Colletotrichum godetiae]KAK1671421.1 hypothetical protein BDP55DRAFT_732276 [Colletotrichum godetiae]
MGHRLFSTNPSADDNASVDDNISVDDNTSIDDNTSANDVASADANNNARTVTNEENDQQRYFRITALCIQLNCAAYEALLPINADLRRVFCSANGNISSGGRAKVAQEALRYFRSIVYSLRFQEEPSPMGRARKAALESDCNALQQFLTEMHNH